MPKAVVLHLEALVPATLPASHGTMAHAAALALFLGLDPALTVALHDHGPHKPFTVGTLSGAERVSPALVAVAPGRPYEWRLTGLTEPVEAALARIAPGTGVRIGEAHRPAVFAVARVSATHEAHPEAREQSYRELYEPWFRAVPPPEVRLRFASPTAFHQGGERQGVPDHALPLPVPRLVFGARAGLLGQWNAYAPAPLDGWEVYVENAIGLGSWRAETRLVEQGGRPPIVGFIGEVTFRPLAALQSFKENPALLADFRRLLGLLADWAFYAGVGWQTTHGLGRARPVPARAAAAAPDFPYRSQTRVARERRAPGLSDSAPGQLAL